MGLKHVRLFPRDSLAGCSTAYHLLPLTRMPARLARHLWMTGTGEGSRTICSTMIVEAIHYPVLPEIPDADFDRSPFFSIIKYQGLDHPRFRKVVFRPQLITWKNDAHGTSLVRDHVNALSRAVSMRQPDSQNGLSQPDPHRDPDSPQVDESH